MKVMVLMLILAGVPSGSARAGEQRCNISLEVINKPAWTLQVGQDAIRGDRNVLNREDNLVFGFIAGQPARFKITEDRMTGRLTGSMVVLQLDRGKAFTKLTGMLDRDRLVAEASDEGIQLRDLSIRLELKPLVSSSPDAPCTLATKNGTLKLVFDGCDSSIAHLRPELLLMLHRLVLPRARQLEDVPVHFRTGRSTGETRANRSLAPQPASMTPHNQRKR